MKIIILVISFWLVGTSRWASTLIASGDKNVADKFDPLFKVALLQMKIIADTSSILLSDIESVENLELRTNLWIKSANETETEQHAITSLKGLEYFSSLRWFKLIGQWNDTLKYIPAFSKLKELRKLEISRIYLSSLDISGCRNLITLICTSCELKTLDLKKNLQLRTLSCAYNQLVELDISRNKQLQTVIASFQSNSLLLSEGGRSGVLSKLVLPDNRFDKEGIRILECSDNNLEKLDISRSPHLRKIDCGWNKLKTLDTSHHLELRDLNCEANYIHELDFSANQRMELLICGLQGYEWARQTGNDYRLLKKLRLPVQKENSEGIYLRKLSIREISEEAIPVFSDYPYLKELNCSVNRLMTIDITKNTQLEILNCSSNPISQLDLHSCVNLCSLNIRYCPLQTLDLSRTKVIKMECDSYDRREGVTKGHSLPFSSLVLIIPKGYHAETINFKVEGFETASFTNDLVEHNLPPQYIRMVVNR